MVQKVTTPRYNDYHGLNNRNLKNVDKYPKCTEHKYKGSYETLKVNTYITSKTLLNQFQKVCSLLMA